MCTFTISVFLHMGYKFESFRQLKKPKASNAYVKKGNIKT